MRSTALTFSLLISLLMWSPAAADDLASTGNNCFTIIVGRAATADGSVIMAHNEDDYNPQVVNHHKVPRQSHVPGSVVKINGGGTLPQVPETWSYIWSEIPGLLFSDSYLNEWGVCICSDACPSREDQPELTDGGITYMLRRIVAERAKTAREGVHIAAMLVEKFGYNSSGRTYSISDPNEGWVFCAVNGKHWMAQRVPDDQVMMIANTYTVQKVDLKDTMNFLASPDIIDYAVKRGWYDPSSGEDFDFAKAYADPADASDLRNIDRQWDGFCQVSQAPPSREQQLPFAVIPKGKLGVRDIMSVLRRHYEGADVFAADSVTHCPHSNKITPICRNDTQTSFVAQLRGDRPADIGLVYWTTLSSPCVSCYIPFYFGIDAFPAIYGGLNIAPTMEEYLRRVEHSDQPETTSAFWAFTRQKYMSEQRYAELAPALRDMFDIVELSALGTLPMFDDIIATEFGQDKSGAAKMMSEFSATFLGLALDVLKRPLPRPGSDGDLGGVESAPTKR